MKRLLLTTLLVLAAPALRAQPSNTSPQTPKTLSAPLPGDKMGVSIHRLPNGLTIYLSPNRLEPRVAAWIAARAGSKQDPSDSTGMAHYLEHMLFKGSSRLGTLDYDKEKPYLDRITALYEKLFPTTDPEQRKKIFAEIDEENKEAVAYEIPNELDKLYKSLGFEGVNAFTSDERTVYVCNFPANRAEAWATLEADRFARPVFRLFQTELETVYEEKNRSLDNASRILDEALERRLYKDHPYGRTTLGSIEHLKNPSLAKMYAFYAAHYRPGNMAVALSGDFDREAMLKLLEKHFGAWKPEPVPAWKAPSIPRPHGIERVEVKYEYEEQVTIAWPTVARSHPDADVLTVMDMVLDNSQAGILNLILNQQQKVKASGSSLGLRNDAGAWYLWAVPKKGQTLDEAEALLLETAGRLKAGEFTDDDLQAIITNFEVSEKAKLESDGSRVAQMIDSFVGFEEWERSIGRLDRLRGVTKADVVRVAKQYLGEDRVVAYRREGKPTIPSITKPKFTNIPIDPTRKSRFMTEMEAIAAKPLEPRWLQEGKDYRVRGFPWGKLYHAKNPVHDLFSATFEFDRGLKHERRLCAAFDLLDLAGAGGLPAEAYKKALYALGTSMSVSCGDDGSSVSLSGLEASYDKSLELAFLRFDAPHVATDALKKMIEVQIGTHRDNKKDPDYVAYALKEYAMKGKGSSVLRQLSDKEIEALDEAKLKDLLRHVFDYARMAEYVGVREPEAAAAAFGAARKAFLPTAPYDPERYLSAEKPRVLFTHRDMVQARVGLYAADTVVDPKEAVDAQYYNVYMNGGMSGVIFQEVREARALAYSAGGGYGMGGRKGDQNVLWGRAGTQADKMVEAAALLKELLLKLPPSPDRFQEARKSVEESYRADVVAFRRVPGMVLHWERLGLPPGDPRPVRFERALSYTLDDLARYARRFEPKMLTFHILGHKERVDLQGLRGLGALEEYPVDRLFPY